MRSDIIPGAIFPDFELSDHTATRRKLSERQWLVFTFELPAGRYGSIIVGLMKLIVLPRSISSSDEIMCGSNDAGLTTARITAPSDGAVKSHVAASPRGSTISHDFLVTNRRGAGQEVSLAAARLFSGLGA